MSKLLIITDELTTLLITFSKHAEEKLTTRQMSKRMIKDVLSNPEHRLYDTLRGSEISAKDVMVSGETFTLVVIYTRRGTEHRIITVYPSKRFREEADRNVKSNRWVFTTRGEKA